MDGPRLRFSLLFVLLILLISISSSPSTASILEGTVVKVADGDTITVLDFNKVQHRVRVAGIDAPEKKQSFGNASGKRLVELVARKEVRVEFQKHDRYGRIVGKVWVRPPEQFAPLAVRQPLHYTLRSVHSPRVPSCNAHAHE